MKRTFDIIVALIGLTFAMPILLILIVAIRLDSRGPALFKQTRVGKHQIEFTCYKLRTMHINTRSLPSHMVGQSAITTLGGFLRKTKLDELPQLWNIVLGDMSFVGPRPCLPAQTELIERRQSLGLYEIRPGVTGVSQIKGIDMSDPKKLALSDSTYLNNMSLLNDIKLILLTVTGAGQGDAANL